MKKRERVRRGRIRERKTEGRIWGGYSPANGPEKISLPQGGSGIVRLPSYGSAKDKPEITYNAIMQLAQEVKAAKEGSIGGTGHYQMQGYKKRGLVGNFCQLDKKFESFERLLWGPDPLWPSVDPRSLTEGQIRKLFDHFIDAVNYSAFCAEMLAEMALEDYSVNLLEEAEGGRELA